MVGTAFAPARALAGSAPPAMVLDVDATDLAHKLLDVREQLAVAPGMALTLLYPQ